MVHVDMGVGGAVIEVSQLSSINRPWHVSLPAMVVANIRLSMTSCSELESSHCRQSQFLKVRTPSRPPGSTVQACFLS